MKIALLVALFATAAYAYSGKDWSNSVGHNKDVKLGLNGVECFEDKIKVCQTHFGSRLSTYDCEGQCGMCALCNSVTRQMVPSCGMCEDGIKACTDRCIAGKKLCNECSKYL